MTQVGVYDPLSPLEVLYPLVGLNSDIKNERTNPNKRSFTRISRNLQVINYRVFEQ
jgi:hypothetical protein